MHPFALLMLRSNIPRTQHRVGEIGAHEFLEAMPMERTDPLGNVDANGVEASAIQDSVDQLIQAVSDSDSFSPPFDVQVNEAGDLLYVMVPLAGNVDDYVSEFASAAHRRYPS